MSKSFTYNLIVTQSKEAIDRLFFDTAVPSNGGLGQTRRDLLQSFEDLGDLADDILISPYNNSDFLSFETEMNGGGTSTFTTIKLVETARVLERFVIPTDGVSEVVINEFKKRIANLGDKADNQFLNEVMSVRPDYYISYGVGDDISKWSGPYCVSLMDTVLSVDFDGIRTLELTFTPTQETIKLFSNKVLLANLTEKKKKSSFDTLAAIADKVTYDKSILVPVAPETDGSLRKVLKPNKDGDSWNNAIRRLIREYLFGIRKSVSIGNILVLFDQDLDAEEDGPIVVKAKPYSDIISTYQAKLREFGIGIFAGGSRSEEQKKRDRAKEDIARKPIKDKIAELNCTLPGVTGGSRNYSKLSKEQIINVENQIKLLEKDLEAIRVYSEGKSELTTSIKIGGLITGNFLRKGVQENVALRAAQKLFCNPDSTSNAGKASTAPPSVILEMAVDVPTDKVVGEKLELLSPLYTFFKTLNEVSETKIQPTIFEENNINTTKLLHKHGLITNPTDPVLFIGDEDIIKNLIYTLTGGLPENIDDPVFSYGDSRRDLKAKWTAYREELKELNPFVRGITSSFGEEIDFGPYEYRFRKKITTDSLVFMHNLKNSNVIELTVDASPYRAELLNLNAELSYKLIDLAANKAELAPDFKIFKYLKNKYGGDASSLGPSEIVDTINNDTVALKMIKEEGVSGLDSYYFFDILRATSSGVGGLKIPTKGNTTKSNADLLRRAIGYTHEVNIRTLPFFNIVNYLKRDCLLVGVPNKIIGSTFREEDLPPPSMYSNRYGIYGYKHVITPDDAYSEFKLFQNNIIPASQLKVQIGKMLDFTPLAAEDAARVKVYDDILDSISSTGSSQIPTIL